MPPPPKPPAQVETIAAILTARYADHNHYNRRNPLEELLFILCSVKTSEKGYRRTYKALRQDFPTFAHLAEAPQESIEAPLVPGGLYRQRSKAIRAILDEIILRFGRATLAPLRGYPDEQCERFLTGLPSVGKKVARCVMMYSLDRAVFPVDTHCWRVARRLGWIRPTAKDGHCTERDMDRLQAKIPPPLRHSLHVNFVSLGREICTALNPKCDRCPLESYCRKVGVPRRVRA